MAALRSGDDESICGSCPHRPLLAAAAGAAPCYVNVGRAPLAVWQAYKRGRYERAPLAVVAQALAGKRLRLGTYGDPAAAPVYVWRAIVALVAGHAGYSHQWQAPWFDHAAWAGLVMASADSVEEAALANVYGMRVFRVSIGLDVQPGEISCPASEEAGRRTTCANCLLCGGTSKRAKDIVIADHAVGHARRVIALQVAA